MEPTVAQWPLLPKFKEFLMSSLHIAPVHLHALDEVNCSKVRMAMVDAYVALPSLVEARYTVVGCKKEKPVREHTLEEIEYVHGAIKKVLAEVEAVPDLILSNVFNNVALFRSTVNLLKADGVAAWSLFYYGASLLDFVLGHIIIV